METPLTKHIRTGGQPLTLKEYEDVGGYKAVHMALKEMNPDQIINEVKVSNLLGRGGAGFPTGLKWSLVPKKTDSGDEPRYLLANADEMEPGAFKDRYLLEGNPHQIIAGIIIAAYAIQAEKAYIFIRWAYKKAERLIRQAISEAYEANYLGKDILGTGFHLDLFIHVSTGRYMCGEETGLINSIEGKRANPRSKPPFPATLGMFGKPSIVNNIETLSFIPHIIENGSEWFKKLSVTGEGGTRLYGASGRVKKPGLWELPLGITLRELLYEHAGGMADGYKFRGAIPGGASTDFVMESHLDTPMDFASLPKVRSTVAITIPGAITNTALSAKGGIQSSLKKILIISATTCSKPKGPTRLGPRRSCQSASSLLSTQISRVAMVITTSNTPTMMKTYLINFAV